MVELYKVFGFTSDLKQRSFPFRAFGRTPYSLSRRCSVSVWFRSLVWFRSSVWFRQLKGVLSLQFPLKQTNNIQHEPDFRVQVVCYSVSPWTFVIQATHELDVFSKCQSDRLELFMSGQKRRSKRQSYDFMTHKCSSYVYAGWKQLYQCCCVLP